MRKILIFISLLFLFVYSAFSQDVQQMDSLFNSHLKSIGDTINKYVTSNDAKVYTYKDDVIFLYVLSDISDFKFEQHGYTHQPMLSKKELYSIKKWYSRHRKKLNWQKIYGLMKNYQVYNDAFRIINNKDTSSFKLFEQFSDSIETERKRLLNMNSLITHSFK